MLSEQKRELESRLQQMSTRQRDRLATEEREARLRRMSIHQRERLEEYIKLMKGKESLRL